MKNIHILPTDKTSRLQSNRYSKLFLSEVPKAYADCINQNIYITSNEEIKEGNWFYNSFLNEISKMDVLDYSNFRQKIILTTDQDLIEDGVQAIDNEFLEWFVKNPNCEYVEVEKSFADGSTFGYGYIENLIYKIIIPKQETKQETHKEIAKQVEIESQELSKQETLEEAKAKLFRYSDEDMNDYANYRLLFKKPIEPKEWFENFKNK